MSEPSFVELLQSAIERAKTRQGCTVEQLAGKIGTSRPTLYMAKKVPRSLSLPVVQALAREAGLNEDEKFELEKAWLMIRLRSSGMRGLFDAIFSHIEPKIDMKALWKKLLGAVPKQTQLNRKAAKKK